MGYHEQRRATRPPGVRAGIQAVPVVPGLHGKIKATRKIPVSGEHPSGEHSIFRLVRLAQDIHRLVGSKRLVEVGDDTERAGLGCVTELGVKIEQRLVPGADHAAGQGEIVAQAPVVVGGMVVWVRIVCEVIPAAAQVLPRVGWIRSGSSRVEKKNSRRVGGKGEREDQTPGRGQKLTCIWLHRFNSLFPLSVFNIQCQPYCCRRIRYVRFESNPPGSYRVIGPPPPGTDTPVFNQFGTLVSIVYWRR